MGDMQHESISQHIEQLLTFRQVSCLLSASRTRAHNCMWFSIVFNHVIDIPSNSPGAMSLAASGSTELATEVTTATAKELKAVGINWV